jgi:hypothetical protein
MLEGALTLLEFAIQGKGPVLWLMLLMKLKDKTVEIFKHPRFM